MSFREDLDLFYRARYTLIIVVSQEEQKVVNEVKEICGSVPDHRLKFVLWDCADSFQYPLEDELYLQHAYDGLSVLDRIQAINGAAIILLKDFHLHLSPGGDIKTLRKLRNLAQSLKSTSKTIIITMPVLYVPEELKDDAVVIDLNPPNLDEIRAIFDSLCKARGVIDEMEPIQKEKMVLSALGLTANQAKRAFSKAIIASGGLIEHKQIEKIVLEKKQIIRKSGALEFFAPGDLTNEVGGLDVLKHWLKLREAGFSKRAEDYRLDKPKGILLVGIPGTGKSLAAKMVAGMWGWPLLRLDIGALFGGFVGLSEENTRNALKLADTIAPCILWVDEIEKGLSFGIGDNGTSKRVIGTILTWMQERTAPVFVVATANNIADMGLEFLRSGRFDQIFFLDLPTEKEREQIFKVHFEKRDRDPGDFDIKTLAIESKGFVGAEIEQSIINAMYIAFNDQKAADSEFKTEHILMAIKELIPQSKSQREVIENLRKWLKEGKAQSASFAVNNDAIDQSVNNWN